jgi:hypothetical protein
MRPGPWSPPDPVSSTEAALIRRLKAKSRFFVFLREIRHELLSAEFQAELGQLYADRPRGQPPIPPGRLALATLLQAYTGLSDADVIDAMVADRRWQLVLDCWDAERPPFEQGTLVHFRQRLIAANLDRRLIERTLELAEATGGFSRQHLKLALDSSPLWGAGRVEDTVNLLGTALRRAVATLAKQAGRTVAEQATTLGVPALAGPSLKGALDLDWTDPTAREQALATVLAALARVEQHLAEEAEPPARVRTHLAAARQVQAQDVAVAAPGRPVLRQGVAPDRRISIADADQRHGRKSRQVRFDGYKRHAARDLEQAGLIRAVAITGANRPDAEATPAIEQDLAAQAATVAEWHIDRAYLSSALVTDRAAGTRIWSKPFPVRNGAQFPKTAFRFDAERQQLTCPAGATRPGPPGRTVRFPAGRCDPCALRAQCTRTKPGTGRSVTLHPEEGLLAHLRAAQATPEGRAKLRERIAVEHTLARLGQVQGEVARYQGLRKQLFDARRAAVVVNLQTLDRLRQGLSPNHTDLIT